MNQKSIKIIVSGKVQGVGFRYATVQLANQMNVTGTVKNLLKGDVEIVACADEETLKLFCHKIEQSPTPFGKVANMQIQDCSNQDFHNFTVKY